MSIVDSTEKALAAVELPDSAAGAVEVLRKLAQMLEGGGMLPDGRVDSTAFRTYLSYAEALQLTPASVQEVADVVKPKEKPKRAGTTGRRARPKSTKGQVATLTDLRDKLNG